MIRGERKDQANPKGADNPKATVDMTKEAIGDIGNIINSASHIPFDRKGEKERRQKEQAQILVRLLPRVLSEQRFYQEIDGQTHLHGLRLLVMLFPQSNDRVHQTFVAYLSGIVKNRVTMTHPSIYEEKTDVDGGDEKYKEKLGPYLRTFLDLPADYLDLVYPEADLPTDSKRKNQAFKVNIPSQG